ncbi:MAG: 3-deoxy-manno-octulosonate cytidylyltransferase [Pseudomonadales bacterium]
MTFTVVIPARYKSTRLPGKCLVDIAGRPMIQWVVEAAQQSQASDVYVATDDESIVTAVQQFGGKALLTSNEHESGTDRLHEAAQLLNLPDEHIVVNVQGDEPLVPPAVIDQVANNLARNDTAGIATLCEEIHSTEEFLNPNAVKVLCNDQQQALYFSRAPIPWPRDADLNSSADLPADLQAFRHVGLYAYRVAFLRQFVSWLPHALEITEKLEQLRALAHGVVIHVEPAVASIPAGIDTAEDLAALKAHLAATEGG